VSARSPRRRLGRVWSVNRRRFTGLHVPRAACGCMSATAGTARNYGNKEAKLNEKECCCACKKPKKAPWTCVVCERAKVYRAACSTRCMRLHERDGRHRKELREQEAQASGTRPPPLEVSRAAPEVGEADDEP